MTILSEQPRPICKVCGIKPCATGAISKLGFQKYRTVCTVCHAKTTPKFRYKSYKKDKCESCGFIAKHSCQLDVDHIDGNKKNDDPSNLQTLCANCHRLKTQLNEEFLNKKWRE